MKDTAIIDLYWQRSEEAIAETQKSYGSYCYSIAFHVLHAKEDAEECVNDTWLRAWNSIPPNRPAKLRLFLGTITRNLSFDKWKSRNALKRGSGEMEVALDELAECVPSANSTEEAVEAAQLQETINRFLGTLSERDRNIFLRRYWYVEECSEIGERYGMKTGTVKTTLFRLRGKLKEYLEREGIVL